jgi:hypothetical protein
MATFNFELQEKITSWKSTKFEIEAETLEEAKKMAIQSHIEGDLEQIGWDDIYGTEEFMFPSDNQNQPTAEISYEEIVIWDNTKE